jgi:hypothetical protein
MPATVRFSWGRTTVLFSVLVALPSAGWASSQPTAPARAIESPSHPDPVIRRALMLLPAPVAVPIEVIETSRLSASLKRAIGRACTFIRIGDPRIYVSASCPAYLGADESRFEAMKLAALLRHEQAHLEGADESRARLIEARIFRELLHSAPAEYQTPGVVYAAALERYAAQRLVRHKLSKTAESQTP